MNFSVTNGTTSRFDLRVEDLGDGRFAGVLVGFTELLGERLPSGACARRLEGTSVADVKAQAMAFFVGKRWLPSGTTWADGVEDPMTAGVPLERER